MRKPVCILLILLVISIGTSAYIYKTSTDRIRFYEYEIGEYKHSLKRIASLYSDLASRYGNLSSEHKLLFERYKALERESSEAIESLSKEIAFLKSLNRELESKNIHLKEELDRIVQSLPVGVAKVDFFVDEAPREYRQEWKYWIENVSIAYYDLYLNKYITLLSDNKRYDLDTEPYRYLILEVPLYKQGTKLSICYVLALSAIPKMKEGAYIVDISYAPRKAEIVINNNATLYIGNIIHGS